MLDSITADSIFAEIMMDETSAKAFLLVEGPDENAVFFGHIAPEVVLIICGGKRNILGAAALADRRGLANVFGLVDTDFDRILGKNHAYPGRIAGTASYDLISDLVLSSPEVLRRTMSAHAASGVRSIEDLSGKDVDEVVFAVTSKLAGVRLASMRNSYPLIFRGYNFSSVVTASYGPSDLLDFLANTPRPAHFTVDSAVENEVHTAFSDVGGHRYFCGGHDVVSAAVALLRQAGAQLSQKAISGTLISFASCQVLASLPCLQALTAMARADAGVDLFDCFAA